MPDDNETLHFVTKEFDEIQEKTRVYLETTKQCIIIKLHKKYTIGWAFYNAGTNLLTRFAEFKSKKYAFGEYDTFPISLDKWIRGRELAEATQRPVSYFVLFVDELFYCNIDQIIDGKIALFEHRDCEYIADDEPFVFVSVNNFQSLGKPNFANPNFNDGSQ